MGDEAQDLVGSEQEGHNGPYLEVSGLVCTFSSIPLTYKHWMGVDYSSSFVSIHSFVHPPIQPAYRCGHQL